MRDDGVDQMKHILVQRPADQMHDVVAADLRSKQRQLDQRFKSGTLDRRLGFEMFLIKAAH